LDFSPIKGPEGNIEFLVYFTKKCDGENKFDYELIKNVVEKSHSNL
jgi:23S rRNA (cytidine1920-2'-O)/16S rRNA (cytidine1409-2'-O)-methyltransferase